ncbi:hypothetical protein ASZ90_010362 [hydrocarbon metagenome]|uniref:Uncharacterized protein n=1 Tax=hydrocarbon metagenome TaxID=938273 RepID=A0A0W8FG85_9ZZZZ
MLIDAVSFCGDYPAIVETIQISRSIIPPEWFSHFMPVLKRRASTM